MHALVWRRRLAGPIVALAAGASLIPLTGVLAAATPSPRAPDAIYAKTCGYCHGQHVAPVIRGRNLPPELIAQTVRTGPRGMPAFRPTEISNAELKALALWISTSKTDPKEHEQ